MFRPSLAACLSGLTLAAACATADLSDPAPDLGDFALGLNIVVADKAQKVPISRTATPEEWEAALRRAVQDRLGRHQGARLYNIGLNLDAYALAPPGVPVVAAPKSALAITANAWDDAAGRRLNPDGKRLLVFEDLSGETLVGSGLTRSREEQMAVLAANAAKAVEDWLASNPDWFSARPAEAGPTPGPAN